MNYTNQKWQDQSDDLFNIIVAETNTLEEAQETLGMMVGISGKYDPRAVRHAQDRLKDYFNKPTPIPAAIITVDKIARVVHEINRAYCTSQGDLSQDSWDEAPEWQKKSSIEAVLFHMNNPEAGPDASHIRWMEEKKKDGWVYGEVKDAEAKTHPSLVDYSEIPASEQAKDYLVMQTVNSLTRLDRELCARARVG